MICFRAGCKTGGHKNWGDCYRKAAVQIDRHGLAGHRDAELKKDKRLDAYENARRNGLRPVNTSWDGIRDAYENGGDKPPLLDVSGLG